MTRAETAAAVVTVAALAGVAAWSMRTTGDGGAGLHATIELSTDSPACPRHGLFRRFDGHAARHALTQPGGWAWFADPPGAAVI